MAHANQFQTKHGYPKKQRDPAQRYAIGAAVRVTNAARVDMIGRVVGVKWSGPNAVYDVRVPGWKADGYPLDVGAYDDELERSTVPKMERAAAKRGWPKKERPL